MRHIALSHLAATAKESLLAAGAIIRKGFFTKRHVDFKSPTNPVTEIDVRAEKKVISIIRRKFPNHSFLAEESDYLKHGNPLMKESLSKRKIPADRYRWVIDPLDGTINYVHQFPQVNVSVAVERGGTILAGGVYDPIRDELFMAERGKGATLNGRRIKVSNERKLRRALVITGFPYDRHKRASLYLSVATRFLKKSMDLRRMGAAALDLAWIACGRADGYFEYNLSPWDVAAGMLLVQEAGGRVSDFDGRPLRLERPLEALASNGFIHRRMIQVLMVPVLKGTPFTIERRPLHMKGVPLRTGTGTSR